MTWNLIGRSLLIGSFFALSALAISLAIDVLVFDVVDFAEPNGVAIGLTAAFALGFVEHFFRNYGSPE